MSMVKKIQTSILPNEVIFNEIYEALSHDGMNGNLIAKKEIRGDKGQINSVKHSKRLKELFKQYGLPTNLLSEYEAYETERYIREIEKSRNGKKSIESTDSVVH